MSIAPPIVGVCGAGTMGAGIAQVAAQAGHRVLVLDRDETALTTGRATLAAGASKRVARGKLTAADAARLQDAITWTLDAPDLRDAGLVIEAIIEDKEAKSALFRSLEGVVGEDCVLATNTSSLAVTELAAALQHPARFIGLHFFNPAQALKLVEVVPALQTAPSVTDRCLSLMAAWGKIPARVRDTPGFVVNRCARPFYAEAWLALEHGVANPATLDHALTHQAGFRMGPFALGDLIGHDINAKTAETIFDGYRGLARFRPSLRQSQLVAAGRLGRKTGRGVFDYDQDIPPPTAAAMHAGHDRPGAPSLSSARSPIRRLVESAGVPHATDDAVPPGFARLHDVLIGVADGAPAAAHAHDLARPVVLLDWFSDISSIERMVITASDDDAAAGGAAFAAALGADCVRLADRPGGFVYRTLLQLANACADAALDRVATEEEIDAAMIHGVNYPFGPLAWLRRHGPQRAVAALDAISHETGDPIYAPSPYLRRIARESAPS